MQTREDDITAFSEFKKTLSVINQCMKEIPAESTQDIHAHLISLSQSNGNLTVHQLAVLIVCAAKLNDIESLKAHLVARYSEEVIVQSKNYAIAKLAHEQENDNRSITFLISQFDADINIAAYHLASRGASEKLSYLQLSSQRINTTVNMDYVAFGYIDGGNGTAAEYLIARGEVSAKLVSKRYAEGDFRNRSEAIDDAAEAMTSTEALVRIAKKYQDMDKSTIDNKLRTINFKQVYGNISQSGLRMFSSSRKIIDDIDEWQSTCKSKCNV